MLFGTGAIASGLSMKRTKGIRKLTLLGVTIILTIMFVLLAGGFIRVMWFPFPQV
jgi:hypothetical protein